MKKSLLLALTAGLVAYTSSVSAYTNKTFLMPRPQNVDLPMQSTTFHEFKHRGHRQFKGNFQLSPFYKESTAERNEGKYFLMHNKSTINLPESANVNDEYIPLQTASTVTNDLDLGYLYHRLLTTNGAETFNDETGTVKFHAKPQQNAAGCRVDYCQDLNAILHGLYFYANTTIARVQNKMQFNVISNSLTTLADPTDIKATLESYFKGEFENTEAAWLTQKLTNAKMNGHRTATGFADIDLGLGYKFINKEKHCAFLALAITIPTGNKAKGEYVFEPIYGNGDHFGVGADLGGHRQICGSFEHNLKVSIIGKYRYLFEHNEQRTLGIVGRNLGQYALLGMVGQQKLVPAANVLTLPVDVTPGSQFDGIAALNYNYRGFSADLGYNLYYREKEKVKLRSSFVDNPYAVAARGFDTSKEDEQEHIIPFTITAANVDGGDIAAATINDTTIDTTVAQTPEQWTNSIYAGLGYVGDKGSNPWMLGIGGKYEFQDHNSALEQWGIWFKAGIGF